MLNLPSEASGAYYIPYRSPSEYNSGALVWKSTSQIRFAYLNITGPNSYSFTNYGVTVPNEMSYAAQLSMPMGSNLGYNNIYFGASQSGGLEQLVLTGIYPTPWNTGFPAIGMGIVPDTTLQPPANDWFCVAYFSGVQLYSVSAQMNSTTITFPAPTAVLFNYSVPVPAAPGFFACSPSNSGYYLSAKMPNGKYETYYWSTTLDPPTLLPLSVQVTGMLSDGRLLADSGSSIGVYSPQGNFLFTIPTGALHFVHERYDSVNLCWISVFTRVVEIPKNDDNNDYLFQIFEIKTSDLKNLAN